eukprot:7431439-Alexandrium_andersonii.AAC.1
MAFVASNFAVPLPRISFPVHAAIGATESPVAKHGEVLLLSPPELVWSLILAVADSIDKSLADEELQVWRNCLLDIPMVYEVTDNKMD